VKILKTEIVFESANHYPPLRVVQQDWERDDGDLVQQGLAQWNSKNEPLPAKGFALIVEVAKDTDSMGKLLWKKVAV